MKRVYLGYGALLWIAALVAGSFALERWRLRDAAAPDAQLPSALLIRGEEVARTCQGCHSLSERDHRVGPHLINVVGRRAGTTPGFDYSAAMRASGLIWTREHLKDFLVAPTRVVPGTAMTAEGWSREDADAVIAFLEGLP